jgi:cellulose synthase/poly-beta-1,6-N-acetylglucosamine synthase-like glycosyltransferase
MLDLLLVPITVVYLLIITALFIYGVNFYYLTLVAWRARRAHPQPPPMAEWPPATVQLPIYNERYVAERLIDAAANLDYPVDKLEIQVLDDSTDDTVELARQAAARARGRGINVQHLRRTERTGYKAGALADGLERATGEFIAIFDADFIPPPDFLRRTVPHFQRDARLAFAQTRWGHVNRDHSFLTLLQALSIDAHFVVEQFARARAGHWFNFNGTAGVWRRAALLDAGGWRADTLTEDLDISYRAFLRGWRALYLRDVEVPAELPVSFSAYRRQQHRWARGSLECALKLIPRVWATPAPLARKVQATLHLTGYGVHLFLFALALLYPLILLLSARYPGLLTLFGIAPLFNLTAIAPTVFFLVGQHELGRNWLRQLPLVLCLSVLGQGMMLNTARAAWHIFTRRAGAFERTPKVGLLRHKSDWLGQRYRIRVDAILIWELAFAVFNLGTVALAVARQNWAVAVYAALFGAGLLFVCVGTLAQTLAIHRRQK